MDRETVAISWLKRNIGKRLVRGSFARNVAVLAGGTALGQAITVLASPILTRLYAPEDFGVLAVYSSILGILSVVASWRYELAIPLPEEDGDGVNLVALSLGIVVLMSFLIGLGAWLLGDQIVSLVNVLALRPYLWLIPVGLLLVGSYQVFNCWAVRKKDFVAIAKAKLNQGVAAVSAQIVTGFLITGPLGLLIGQALGQSAGVLALASRFKKQKTTKLSVSHMSFVARRYSRFPLLSVWPALVNSLGLQLPLLSFSIIYGPEITGWFALTHRVLGIPLSLISASTAFVLFGQAAEDRHSGKQLDILFWKVIRQQGFIGIPMLFFVPLFPIIFPIILGQNWKQSGIYASIWIFPMVANFIASPTGGILDVLERQDLFIARELCRLVMIGGIVAFSAKFSFPPFVTVSILSGSMVVFAFIYASLSLYAIKNG